MNSNNGKKCRVRHLDAEKLEEELEAYRRNGCILKLNGKLSDPVRVTASCVREQGGYMRDFLWTEEDQVKEINFIRVRNR